MLNELHDVQNDFQLSIESNGLNSKFANQVYAERSKILKSMLTELRSIAHWKNLKIRYLKLSNDKSLTKEDRDFYLAKYYDIVKKIGELK